MKKSLFLILGMLMSLQTSQTQAWSYGEFISCSGINRNIDITFKTSYGQLVHDINTPQKKIGSLMTKTPEKGFFTSGLATLKIKKYIHIKKAAVIPLDENATCVMPREIEITFGYTEPTIYVANEYDIKSCDFSQILRHEQTHQRINKLTLDYFLPLIYETTKKTILDVRAIKVPSPKDAKKGLELLHKYYTVKMDAIIKEFEKEREKEQKKLDNRINYTFESNLCLKFNEKHKDRPILKKGKKLFGWENFRK